MQVQLLNQKATSWYSQFLPEFCCLPINFVIEGRGVGHVVLHETDEGTDHHGDAGGPLSVDDTLDSASSEERQTGLACQGPRLILLPPSPEAAVAELGEGRLDVSRVSIQWGNSAFLLHCRYLTLNRT